MTRTGDWGDAADVGATGITSPLMAARLPETSYSVRSACYAWPGRSCGPPMDRPDLLAIAAETGGQMVIDDAAGLHRRVRGHRAGENEAVPP